MADPSVSPPPPPSTPPSGGDQQTDFNIAEEYGTARKSLPPAGIVAICVAVVVAIVAVYAWINRARPHSTGTIDDVVFVSMQGQDMVMVAVNLSLQNNSHKPSWIQSIQTELDAGGNKFTDDATPAVDAQRYFQALPDLKQHALNLLTTETRINPGEKISGTIVVTFPVKADVFTSRKSLTVRIKPYDELAVIITK